jgi:Arc/MetJ-type ribon-helix-helix transcriptional regulator
MGMNVNLTPGLEGLGRRKVAAGKYTSASEAVHRALRRAITTKGRNQACRPTPCPCTPARVSD